jgi:uncharacterized protein with PQ loop repeat
MYIITLLATLAATLSTIANIPQVLKVRKKWSTDDLHSHTVLIHFIAAIVWSVYGALLNLYILSIESAIVGFLNLLILLAIVRDRYWCPKTNVAVV